MKSTKTDPEKSDQSVHNRDYVERFNVLDAFGLTKKILPTDLRAEDANMQPLQAEALTKPLISIKKVLVAVDLSAHSEATASYAAELARSFGASLTVVHVYEPVPLCEYASETTYTVLEDERDQLQKLLDELALKVQTPDLVCKSVFLVGNAVEQITTLAHDMHADLIVTASHHPTFLGSLINLDKAPKIMHRAPCPVLVYHEKGK